MKVQPLKRVTCSCGQVFRRPETLWRHFVREKENIHSDLRGLRLDAEAGETLYRHVADEHRDCDRCQLLGVNFEQKEIPF